MEKKLTSSFWLVLRSSELRKLATTARLLFPHINRISHMLLTRALQKKNTMTDGEIMITKIRTWITNTHEKKKSPCFCFFWYRRERVWCDIRVFRCFDTQTRRIFSYVIRKVKKVFKNKCLQRKKKEQSASTVRRFTCSRQEIEIEIKKKKRERERMLPVMLLKHRRGHLHAALTL